MALPLFLCVFHRYTWGNLNDVRTLCHTCLRLHEEVISVTFSLRSVVAISETQTESKIAESLRPLTADGRELWEG